MKPETFQRALEIDAQKTELQSFKLALKSTISDEIKNLKLIATNKFEKPVCKAEFQTINLPPKIKTEFLSSLETLVINIDKELSHLDLEFKNLN